MTKKTKPEVISPMTQSHSLEVDIDKGLDVVGTSTAMKDAQHAKATSDSVKKASKSKTMDTYLKNQNRMLMSSISIADKKAAILVRLNTTIVSSLIVVEGFLSADLDLNKFILPVLIVGLSLSLLFAIMVAKPFSYTLYKVLNKIIKPKYPRLEQNNFFLIENVEFEEYEKSMNKVMASQELQFGNLTRFNYFMSRSISQKYVMLEVAYAFFMLTLFVVMLLYIFSKL